MKDEEIGEEQSERARTRGVEQNKDSRGAHTSCCLVRSSRKQVIGTSVEGRVSGSSQYVRVNFPVLSQNLSLSWSTSPHKSLRFSQTSNQVIKDI